MSDPLPAASVQVSATVSNAAPEKPAGAVTDTARTSLVSTVQLWSSTRVPPFTVHSDGTSEITTSTFAMSSVDGDVSPRFIGSPAMPAGATVLGGAPVPPPVRLTRKSLAMSAAEPVYWPLR